MGKGKDGGEEVTLKRVVVQARTFKGWIARQDLLLVIAALLDQDAEWIKIEDDRGGTNCYVVLVHVAVTPTRIRGTRWIYI